MYVWVHGSAEMECMYREGLAVHVRVYCVYWGKDASGNSTDPEWACELCWHLIPRADPTR